MTAVSSGVSSQVSSDASSRVATGASWTAGAQMAPWRGELVDLGSAAAQYTGVFSATAWHRHYAIQLIDCPGGLSLHVGTTTAADRRHRRDHTGVTGAIIGSGVPHRLLSAGEGTFLYVAPHSSPGRALRRRLHAEGHGAGALVVTRDGGRSEFGPGRWLRADDAAAGGEPADEIVLWIGAQVRGAPHAQVRLADVGRRFHRSGAAVSRLLRRELAVSFACVVRWERLRLAIDLIAAGASCTRAAHDAGFHDGPHFTRVCKAMFGIPPRLLELGALRPADLDALPAGFADPQAARGDRRQLHG